YPRETVIAEKFQAMVHLGTLNSRMKDFYDIWLLSRQFDFGGSSLADAVAGTFKNRETAVETKPVALTSDFSSSKDKQKQWAAFLRKSQIEGAPPRFEDVASALRGFLLPIARSLVEASEFNSTWRPPGPWTEG
ncbi:MAG: nucleotidyl transferase AbiEii/AbiGii toxin family protein, partial [Myxococcales bacterium]|nr:nucleotidyl transferase AbiEii/AbiGii toxin family protein [Myxococcales bacterium]